MDMHSIQIENRLVFNFSSSYRHQSETLKLMYPPHNHKSHNNHLFWILKLLLIQHFIKKNLKKNNTTCQWIHVILRPCTACHNYNTLTSTVVYFKHLHCTYFNFPKFSQWKIYIGVMMYNILVHIDKATLVC